MCKKCEELKEDYGHMKVIAEGVRKGANAMSDLYGEQVAYTRLLQARIENLECELSTRYELACDEDEDEKSKSSL